ncbi:MAG TPA: AtpZ/AtpI family protein [Desulfobacteria bacterium]|nr:AtpZ/AtpI family protein [Desulfobacteria bacterium]
MIDRKGSRYLVLGTSIGSSLAGSMLAGFFVGRYLDAKFGTYPWLDIIGVLLGLVMGAISVVQILRAIGTSDNRE